MLPRISYLFVGALLVFGTFAPGQAGAQDCPIRAIYSIESSGYGRFIADVLVTNMTPETLRDWGASFQFDSIVSEVSEVRWQQTGTLHEVWGTGWTRDIDPGQVAWFTISAVLSGVGPEYLTELDFNYTDEAGTVFAGIPCEVEGAPIPETPTVAADDLRFALWIDHEGVTTYDGYIIIENPTKIDIESWELEFVTPSLITRIDHVNWDRFGDLYRVTGTGWTSTIEAMNFVLIGFHGVHDGAAVPPSACRFNGEPCEFKDAWSLIPTPKSTVTIVVDLEAEDEFWGTIFIDNPQDDILENWKLVFDWTADIHMMDDVSWERSGDTYTVYGQGRTKRIYPDEDIWFMIMGALGEDPEFPTNCTLNGHFCHIEASGFETESEAEEGGGGDGGGGSGGGSGGGGSPTCSTPGSGSTTVIPDLDFRFLNRGDTTFIALVEIANNGGDVIDGWSLEFDLVDGMVVTRFWGGTMTETADGYRVESLPENQCIEPAGKVTFGFSGNHDGRYAEPIGCQFDGNACIFFRPSSTATEPRDDLPTSIRLLEAYPNPFNPATTIQFESTENQQVRLELFDVTGRRISMLYEGRAFAGEEISVRFDGSSLTSGTYLLRLSGENSAVRTQPLFLLK